MKSRLMAAVARLTLQLRKKWLHCLLLALVGCAVHAPALQGELIWDDQYLARDNPFIKSPLLALEAFRHHLFIESYSAHYRPVQNLSMMFDYIFWNTNTFGFHLTNVLLHVASGILLYLLLQHLLGSLAPTSLLCSTPRRRIEVSLVPIIVAAIWIVHPVHSAAVDYISGRADSLAFLLACGGWLLFLRARNARTHFCACLGYMAAAAVGLLALCSRETACIWVALFILHLLLFDRSSSVRLKAITVLACVTVLALYAGLRQLPAPRTVPGPTAGWSLPMRSVLMLRALGDYGRLLLFPSNLHMERTVFNGAALENEVARRGSMELEYLSIGGIAVAACLAFFALRPREGQRLRAFGAAWFAIGFVPISNIVDLNATVAEHWMYLPSVGFFMFLGGCAIALPVRLTRAVVTLASVAVAVLASRSFQRSSDWLDAKTFYQRTAAAGGTSCRVSLNLGQIYCAEGDYVRAEHLFRYVLKIQPDYTIARNNLADVLAHQGKQKDAEKLLAEATVAAHDSRKDYPRTWVAAINLAHMLHERHDDVAAEAVLDNARTDYPDTWELVGCETELLRAGGKLDPALALVRPYAEKHWWHYAAWMAMGRLLAEKGDVARATSVLRHATWLDVRSTDGLNLIALICVRQNQFDEAFRAQCRAVGRQPDQPRQYVLLSNILEKMGRSDEARAALAQVSRLRSLADAAKSAN